MSSIARSDGHVDNCEHHKELCIERTAWPIRAGIALPTGDGTAGGSARLQLVRRRRTQEEFVPSKGVHVAQATHVPVEVLLEYTF